MDHRNHFEAMSTKLQSILAKVMQDEMGRGGVERWNVTITIRPIRIGTAKRDGGRGREIAWTERRCEERDGKDSYYLKMIGKETDRIVDEARRSASEMSTKGRMNGRRTGG